MTNDLVKRMHWRGKISVKQVERNNGSPPRASDGAAETDIAAVGRKVDR